MKRLNGTELQKIRLPPHGTVTHVNVRSRTRAPREVSTTGATCLYYPFFSIQDQDWTKRALLFWDTIATIIPKTVDFSEIVDPSFHALMSAGALRPWAVSSEIRSDVAKSAVTLIDKGIHLQFPDGEPFDVSFGKVTPQLREALNKRDLVRGATPRDITLDRNVALMILTLLAHRLAEANSALPLTDDPQLASCYIHVGQAQSRTESALSIVQRDLDFAIPDLRNVDLDAWLRFREEKGEALDLYRSGLRRLAREAARATEPDELDEILEERQQELASKTADRKGVFKVLTSDITWTSLRLIVEVGTTAPINPAIAMALVGVEGAAFVAQRFRRKELHHLSFVQEAARKFGE